MDQSRLNFLIFFLNFKKIIFKNYFLLNTFELNFIEKDESPSYNNNYYYNRKKLTKKINLKYPLKLKKVFKNNNINNFIFF